MEAGLWEKGGSVMQAGCRGLSRLKAKEGGCDSLLEDLQALEARCNRLLKAKEACALTRWTHISYDRAHKSVPSTALHCQALDVLYDMAAPFPKQAHLQEHDTCCPAGYLFSVGHAYFCTGCNCSALSSRLDSCS